MKNIVNITRIFGLMVLVIIGSLTLSFSPKMQASLADLPREIHREILVALAQSGTLDEATKSIRALAITNKKFNELINKPETTQILVNILANRFTRGNRIDATLALGTMGAKDYLDQLIVTGKYSFRDLWAKAALARNFPMIDYLTQKAPGCEFLISILIDLIPDLRLFAKGHYNSEDLKLVTYRVELIEWLSHKIDFTSCDYGQEHEFKSLLQRTLKADHSFEEEALRIIAVLLKTGIPLEEHFQGSSFLAEAVKSRSPARVQLLLDYGARNKDALRYATPKMRKILKDVVLYMD